MIDEAPVYHITPIFQLWLKIFSSTALEATPRYFNIYPDTIGSWSFPGLQLSDSIFQLLDAERLCHGTVVSISLWKCFFPDRLGALSFDVLLVCL